MRNLIHAALGIFCVGTFVAGQRPTSPIHFSYREIPFRLENCETERRYAPETMAGGVGVFDFDNDGDLDIVFANGADIRTLQKSDPKYSNRLFSNDGKANFTDVTARAGLAGTGYDTGVAIGDYDNDGFKDLFLAGVHRNTLYHNNGNGTFTDVTEKAGLKGKADSEYGPMWAVGGVWFDANQDGRLDLFVVNYLVWEAEKEPVCQFEGRNEYCHPKMYKELPNQLFVNGGDGTFRDVSKESGIWQHRGKGMGAGAADFDLDGKLDIFVANDKLFNSFFHNRGKLKFEERAFEVGVALAEHGNMISGMGVDFRDIDNDGYPDILLVALDNETFPIYRNTGKGAFQEVTASSGMTAASRPMAGYSPTIIDFDSDGRKDLFVTRGHVQSLGMSGRVQVNQHNTVFRNLGNWKFAVLTQEAGLAVEPPSRHRGSAFGDLNGDGRVDAVVSALSAKAEIWINDSPAPYHWLALNLEGTKSNRDGAGARVKVVSKTLTQYNHAGSTMGYASSSATPLYFGLGPDTAADLVEITWPSGRVQQLKNVQADRVVQVKEQ